MEPIPLVLSDDSKVKGVREILKLLLIDDDTAKRIDSVFCSELEAGMKDGLKSSSLQMENTYVPELMNGQESGKYLALDLGGTNFRVILLELKDGKVIEEEISYYEVKESLRLGPGEELFDFLAVCIHDFVVKHNLTNENLPLGFTFSFPMTQTSLNCGILITWTKSFNCPGVVGTDAVEHLNAAIRRHGNLNVEVIAILNDTTGTLVKGSYDHPNACIGLILGTGCNGAYLEKAEKVLRWGGHKYDAKQVVVDPEFGAFGDNGCIDFIKSEFDIAVDKGSLLPGSFTFEKYFAGKYMGEQLRFILSKLHEQALIFPGQDSNVFGTKHGMTAADVSKIEEDTVGDKDENCKDLANKWGLNASGDDIAVMKFVCSALTHRCALLVSIPLACFIRRMEKDFAAIAVTGSLYKHHPRLKSLLEHYVRKFSPGFKSETFLSDDGSGLGAGLVAAIADRLRKSRT